MAPQPGPAHPVPLPPLCAGMTLKFFALFFMQVCHVSPATVSTLVRAQRGGDASRLPCIRLRC